MYNKIPDEMRKCIVLNVINNGQSVAITAKLFGLRDSIVRGIVWKFQQTGSFAKGKKRCSPANKKMRPIMLRWISKQLDDNPALTIAALTKKLNDEWQIDVSPQSVHRWVNHELQYRLKLLCYEVPENNSPECIAARKAWFETFMNAGGNLAECIHVDEAGFNVHLTRRLGRAEVGVRPRQRRPTQRGRNLTLIVAIGREGIITSHVHWGSFRSATFQDFIFTDVLPRLHRARTIICVNARIHKSKELKAEFMKLPHGLEFIPPYSPYFDAAEWAFGSVEPFVNNQEFLNQSTLEQHIMIGLSHIAQQRAEGWMREVTRNFQLALQGRLLGAMYSNKGLIQHQDMAGETDTDASGGEQNGGCIRVIL